MKWYEYDNILINIEDCIAIHESKHDVIKFYNSALDNGYIDIIYKDKDELDVEFSKIKEMLGIKTHTSRCC